MKNKQDILNAFRERFGEHEVLCGLEEYPHAKCSCEYPEIIKWLLTTLTEFERGMREEVIKDVGYKVIDILTNGNYINGISAVEIANELESQLEKEKHPSK